MNTTTERLAMMTGYMRTVDFEDMRPAIGRRLHATGKPYSACTTNAECDGWVAAFSASIDAGRVEVREPVAA